jgi:hypothetical protein
MCTRNFFRPEQGPAFTRRTLLSFHERKALEALPTQAPGHGRRTVMLSGEIGTGKTSAAAFEQIKNANVAYVFNLRMTVLELLHSYLRESFTEARNHKDTTTF